MPPYDLRALVIRALPYVPESALLTVLSMVLVYVVSDVNVENLDEEIPADRQQLKADIRSALMSLGAKT